MTKLANQVRVTPLVKQADETASSSNTPPDENEPRIFFSDEPRPTIWAILDDETRLAIKRFAHGDLDAGDDLVREGIAIEHAFDTAAGWHDVNPIVSIAIDGNVWNIEFEAHGNEDNTANEDHFENEEGPAA